MLNFLFIFLLDLTSILRDTQKILKDTQEILKENKMSGKDKTDPRKMSGKDKNDPRKIKLTSETSKNTLEKKCKKNSKIHLYFSL